METRCAPVPSTSHPFRVPAAALEMLGTRSLPGATVAVPFHTPWEGTCVVTNRCLNSSGTTFLQRLWF